MKTNFLGPEQPIACSAAEDKNTRASPRAIDSVDASTRKKLMVMVLALDLALAQQKDTYLRYLPSYHISERQQK